MESGSADWPIRRKRASGGWSAIRLTWEGARMMTAMTHKERDMIYLALLNKANDLRHQASGRPREERDLLILAADHHLHLAQRISRYEIAMAAESDA